MNMNQHTHGPISIHHNIHTQPAANLRLLARGWGWLDHMRKLGNNFMYMYMPMHLYCYILSTN